MCGRFFDSVVGADYCSICCVVWPITDFHNCMYFLLLPPETQADRCDAIELSTSSNVRIKSSVRKTQSRHSALL